MIRKDIVDVANNFAEEMSELFQHSELAKLDFSWPSVGVLDRLTMMFRGRTEISQNERKLIHCIACYLACMAHDVWSVAYKAKVVVSAGKVGVELSISDTPFVDDGEVVSLKLEEELFRVLRGDRSEVPIIAEFSRALPPSYNVLSLFSLGILLGPSPVVDGSWMEKPLGHFQQPIDDALVVMSKSTARMYSRCFSEDTLGKELCSSIKSLLYPATLMVESFPVEDSVQDVVSYWKENNFTKEDLLVTARNMSMLADERISLSATALYYALTDQMSETVAAQVEYLGANLIILYRAIDLVRLSVENAEPWHVKDSIDKSDLVRMSFERSVGLLPWIRFNVAWMGKHYEKNEVRSLIKLLFSGSLESAKLVAENIIEDDPSQLEVRIQHLFLLFLSAEYKTTIQKLQQLRTEPRADDLPQLHFLRGLCEAQLMNLDKAERNFREAFSMCSQKNEYYSEIGLNFLKVLVVNHKFSEASEVADCLVHPVSFPLELLRTKVAAYAGNGELAKVQAADQRIVAIAPLHQDILCRKLYLQQR